MSSHLEGVFHSNDRYVALCNSQEIQGLFSQVHLVLQRHAHHAVLVTKRDDAHTCTHTPEQIQD